MLVTLLPKGFVPFTFCSFGGLLPVSLCMRHFPHKLHSWAFLDKYNRSQKVGFNCNLAVNLYSLEFQELLPLN